MMASVRSTQQEYLNYNYPSTISPLDSPSSAGYGESRRPVEISYYPSSSVTYVPESVTPSYGLPLTAPSGPIRRSGPVYTTNAYDSGPMSSTYGNSSSYRSYSTQSSLGRESRKRSPDTYLGNDYMGSPSTSDTALDMPSRGAGASSNMDRSQPPRRSSNRDEFDGPHQFLPRPPPEYIAEQDRDLPHLPTNLVVQEQDVVLNKVNDRLSQCAYDFVAKYEFPIPVDPKMRPVERPEDREWTEWVYLLKRLATKRRIPARVLYNGQIRQLVTILENSLEMRHAARSQSRPLKDDRNILQLISAGIQVAKILKDSSAMSYLDDLYVSTENQIQGRSFSRGYR